MNNRILLDSCILIEYTKGTKTDLLEHLMENDFEICYNSIVASEFLFHFLAHAGGKSPLTLKESKKVKTVLDQTISPTTFIAQYSYLTIDEPSVKLSVELMSEFNLLPNDAIIISNAIHQSISRIATYDPDFSDCCKKYNIRAIQSANDLVES